MTHTRKALAFSMPLLSQKQFNFILAGLMVAGIAIHKPAFCESKLTSAQVIEQLFKTLSSPNATLTEKLAHFSVKFLGVPYEGNALGEGLFDEFDQFDIFRTDAFDCETYVDTIIALSLANDLDSFNRLIKAIRYHQGRVRFDKRNHFISLDWNPNNQAVGFIEDITHHISGKDEKPIAKTATAFINKRNWYAHLPPSRIRIHDASKNEKKQKLALLRKLGNSLDNQTATIAYLPLSALFDEHEQQNDYLFAQIPDGSIIEIVRPNWDLSSEIGTHLNVSHLGFAFRTKDGLRFRHASMLQKKVVDVSLIDYLKSALNSPTIKGINVQVVIQKQS